jgi:hypothetical protein
LLLYGSVIISLLAKVKAGHARPNLRLAR